jgi:hypothetical protein
MAYNPADDGYDPEFVARYRRRWRIGDDGFERVHRPQGLVFEEPARPPPPPPPPPRPPVQQFPPPPEPRRQPIPILRREPDIIRIVEPRRPHSSHGHRHHDNRPRYIPPPIYINNPPPRSPPMMSGSPTYVTADNVFFGNIYSPNHSPRRPSFGEPWRRVEEHVIPVAPRPPHPRHHRRYRSLQLDRDDNDDDGYEEREFRRQIIDDSDSLFDSDESFIRRFDNRGRRRSISRPPSRRRRSSSAVPVRPQMWREIFCHTCRGYRPVMYVPLCADDDFNLLIDIPRRLIGTRGDVSACEVCRNIFTSS